MAEHKVEAPPETFEGELAKKYVRKTNLSCPSCDNAKMMVRAEIDNSDQLECPRCSNSFASQKGQY